MTDTAFTQDSKAVAAYRSALDRSYELTLYTDATQTAATRLGALRPIDHPGLLEELPPMRLTSTHRAIQGFEVDL